VRTRNIKKFQVSHQSFYISVFLLRNIFKENRFDKEWIQKLLPYALFNQAGQKEFLKGLQQPSSSLLNPTTLPLFHQSIDQIKEKLEENLLLAKSAKTCDAFITSFREICHEDETNEADLIEDVAFLFRQFLKTHNTKYRNVDFLWLEQEFLSGLSLINNGIKSIQWKLRWKKYRDLFPDLYIFFQKVPTLKNFALSIKSRKEKEWKNISADSISLARVI
jgi:hypothetical protein